MAYNEPGGLIGLHHVQLAMPPDEEQAAIDEWLDDPVDASSQ
jgi:hypothetical protein